MLTREEVIRYSLKLEETLYPFDKKSLVMIVNKIYDDFEKEIVRLKEENRLIK